MSALRPWEGKKSPPPPPPPPPPPLPERLQILVNSVTIYLWSQVVCKLLLDHYRPRNFHKLVPRHCCCKFPQNQQVPHLPRAGYLLACMYLLQFIHTLYKISSYVSMYAKKRAVAIVPQTIIANIGQCNMLYPEKVHSIIVTIHQSPPIIMFSSAAY